MRRTGRNHAAGFKANVFVGAGHAKTQEPDLRVLPAKIGQRTLENDCVEGALTKAGLLSGRRCSTEPTNCQLFGHAKSWRCLVLLPPISPNQFQAADLALMPRMDAWHLEHPFGGGNFCSMPHTQPYDFTPKCRWSSWADIPCVCPA